MPTDLSAAEHEAAFVDAFVIRERRERFRSQLASKKKRIKLLDRLNHRLLDDIDPRFVFSSPSHTLPPPTTQCYILASEAKLDSTFVAVSDVDTILADAFFGLLVSYIPGKVVAYKDEAPASVVWFYRE